MVYYVIKNEFFNKVFSEKPNIEFLEFDTIEDAIDYTDKIIVFTDGCCINNGKINAKAGIGIYFNENDTRNVSRKINGKQTNNVAELTAVIEVFKILNTENQNVIIYTDSEYVLKCCGNYGEKSEKKNWKNSKGFIPNHELVKEIYNLFKKYKNYDIRHVKAHTGKNDFLSIGNEWADKLANQAIKN